MNDPHVLTDELVRLIDEIEDISIRTFTVAMIVEVFPTMVRPASRNHHLPDEREKYGNLLHSVRVAALCNVMSEAVVINAEDGALGKDIILSAAILHDVRRYGLHDEFEKTAPDHPKLVRLLAQEHNFTCNHFEKIMEIIESHMGKWSEEPVLFVIDPALALHLADVIIARWAEVITGGSEEAKHD